MDRLKQLANITYKNSSLSRNENGNYKPVNPSTIFVPPTRQNYNESFTSNQNSRLTNIMTQLDKQK